MKKIKKPKKPANFLGAVRGVLVDGRARQLNALAHDAPERRDEPRAEALHKRKAIAIDLVDDLEGVGCIVERIVERG